MDNTKFTIHFRTETECLSHKYYTEEKTESKNLYSSVKKLEIQLKNLQQ